MYLKPVVLLGSALAGATLAVTLASCGGAAPAGAARPQASQAAAARAAGQRPGPPASPSGSPQSRGGDAARASTPSPPPPPSPAPAPPGSGPVPGGLYVDAPDGSPHYIIALSLSEHDAISGSVTFLYQDGRTATVGRYTGTVSPGGKLTMVFGSGKALAGAYGRGVLTLANCRPVLAWAASVAGCRFSYHGHVP